MPHFFLDCLGCQGVDLLAALIVDEKGELEKEIQALQSLAILAHLMVRKVNRERDDVVEVFIHEHSNRQRKKKKIAKFHQEKTFLRDNFAKSQEEVGRCHLDSKLLEEERNTL